MTIASRVFHTAGIAITDSEAVSRRAGQVSDITGTAGFYIYSLGFWAAVIASLMGVWQAVPHIFADCLTLLNHSTPAEREAAQNKSPYCRGALGFLALVSIPFAFAQRPLLVVVIFTVIGSLFIPFLSGTLLYLNNRIAWRSVITHNRRTPNAVLIFILLLFLALAVWEIPSLFAGNTGSQGYANC